MDVCIEAIGFLGTSFAIAADAMRRMLPLRIAAVLSSLFFLAYGALIGSVPMIAMELILLPINGFRLLELVRDRRRGRAVAGVLPRVARRAAIGQWLRQP